jgi:hypothetical protein
MAETGEEVVAIDLAIMGDNAIINNDLDTNHNHQNDNIQSHGTEKKSQDFLDNDEDDLVDITEETNFIEEVVFSEGNLKENILKYARRIKKRYILLLLYILVLLFLVFLFLLLLSIYLTENGYVSALFDFIEDIGR